jgi:hypothetical protein
MLRLLSAAGQPARAAAGAPDRAPGHGPALISFIRAVPRVRGAARYPARSGPGPHRQGP